LGCQVKETGRKVGTKPAVLRAAPRTGAIEAGRGATNAPND
jgi:hypothetical protein